MKSESMVESSDIEETIGRNRSESLDKEEITVKTGGSVESHGKQEMETGRGIESSDKEETMTKIVSSVESHDKDENTTKADSIVEMDDKEDTTTKKGDKIKSHEKAEKMTGRRVESPDKEEMKAKAGVITNETSKVDPFKKCAHGHLVYQCGICFRPTNELVMEVSSMRRGWHMCTICHMGFRDPAMQLNHFKKFHKMVAPSLYKCPICGAHIEGNQIMEHMNLHEDTNVFQNHLVSIRDSSASHAKPSKGKTLKSFDASSAISTTVDLSRLMNCRETRTASKPARDKLTRVTSDCVKEQGEDGVRIQNVLANSSLETSDECKEVIPDTVLCHICGAGIENRAFEEHIQQHDMEISLDPDVSDTAHGTLKNTQVQLCHLCGADVTSDVFEQHVKQHQNPALTSSHDIAGELFCESDSKQLAGGIPGVKHCDVLEKLVTEDKIPSSSDKLELPSCRRMSSEEEVPCATPTDFESSELKYAEYCKEQLRLVKEYSVSCCYHKKDQKENADHWLFNEICGWHMCSSCNMGFHGHQLYSEHLLQVHNIEKPSTNVCPTCGSTVESEDLPMHMKDHERDETYVENDSGWLDYKRFPCFNCSKCFLSFSMFKDHIKEHNQVVSMKKLPLDFHLCNVCGSHVLGEDNLRAHINLHQAVESPNDCCTSLFRCKICSISFPSNESFMRHMERWHLKRFDSNVVTKRFNKYAVTVYKCVCLSLFVDILDFKRHVQRKHPEALRERMRTEQVVTDTSEDTMVDDVLGHPQRLMYIKNTHCNNNVNLRRESNIGLTLCQEKETTGATLSNELTCRHSVSVQISSESHKDHQEMGPSSDPCQLQHEEDSFSDSHEHDESECEDNSDGLMVLAKTDGSFRGLKNATVSGEYKICSKSVGAAVQGDENDDESNSSCHVEMDCHSCSSSETSEAGEGGIMKLVPRMPHRSEFSASDVRKMQDVMGSESSFRDIKKDSGESESKYSITENMLTYNIEGKVCDLELEDDNCRTKTRKGQAGFRNSTQNTRIVGVDPAVDGGAQDVAMAINVSEATSSTDPLVKVLRCDKEGAMVKVFGKGLEGYCSCTLCGRIFRNENDFVRHCKDKMTHKILKTVHHKNLSVRNRAESEGHSESTSKSGTYVVASTDGRDVSLSLCSCGKLLVGQDDLDKHLQAYRTPDKVWGPHSLRNMKCDCGIQTGCDHRSCQGHPALGRLRERMSVKQLDKGVMVDEEDINVTLSLIFDENMDDTNSVGATKESGVDTDKVNCIRRNGSTMSIVSNCTKGNGPILFDNTLEKKHSASNSSNEENLPTVLDIERENRPCASNTKEKNGPSASNISGENGPSILNIKREKGLISSLSGENGAPRVSNLGESTILSDTDSNTGSEFMVKRESPAHTKNGVNFSESLLTADSTQKDCSSGSSMISSSSSSSSSTSSSSTSASGKVQVHMCSLCRIVLLQKEDMVHHLSRHKSYICLCSIVFLDFVSFMCHVQTEHKMCASDQNPVFVNLLGPKPQIISRTDETVQIFDNLDSDNFVSSQSGTEEMLDKNMKFKGYFTCECHEIFLTETDYHDHLRKVISKGKHSRKEWNHCFICGMAFATLVDYMLHLKNEHQKKGRPMQMAANSQKISAVVKCEDCGIQFSNVMGLKVHQRLYQGTFKCTHRQDQVRAEMTRARLADLGVSLRADKPGTWGSKDSAMLASKNDGSQVVEMGTKDSAMLASKNDDSQAVVMGIPIPEVEVGTASKHDLNPDSASDFTIQKKANTCSKTIEMYVIGSDGKTVIKTESGAKNTVVASDAFIITRNEDVDEEEEEEEEEDTDNSEDEADVNSHDAMESDPHGDVNPSEIITPGFGFMGSDSTKWTMMVPMVTIKKEPEECIESLGDNQSVLGDGNFKEDVVKTEVKVEPADPETGSKWMGNGVDAKTNWMLPMSCGNREDELDSVEVKEEPASDEELSQTAVGNMVYIHKSSQDIFDEHERQQPETQEQPRDAVWLWKNADEEQRVSQQRSLTKQNSVNQKQQEERAKQQAVEQQPIPKPRTVKQQLFLKRQLAKQQGLVPEPVREEPPTVKLQPKKRKQSEKQVNKTETLIWVHPKPQTVDASLSVANAQSTVTGLQQLMKQPQPGINPQQVAQQQSMLKLKTLEAHQILAVQQPKVKLNSATQQQLMVKLNPATQQQLMVKLKVGEKQQPAVKLQAVTQQQPLKKPKTLAPQQPLVKHKAVKQKKRKVKLKTPAPQEPMLKLQKVVNQPSVVKLQSLIQEQTGTQQKQLFNFHVVTEQTPVTKVKGLPQKEVVTPQCVAQSQYECGLCSNAFKSPEGLLAHVKTHSKKMQELNRLTEDSNSFSLKVALESEHPLHASSTDKSYGCPVCKETFPQSCQLLGHLQTHQKQANVMMCVVCGSQFKQASSLRKHMHCHMRESGNGLTELVKKVDPALMPVAESYPCEICGLVFRSKNRKAVHVRYVHKQMAPNKCVLCEKTFYSPSELERHMRTHTGEKPFGCDQCGKAFALSTTLKDHLRSHTGERPFKCSVCFKSYSSSSILGRHKLTHVGERKFKCDICGKSFLYSNSLTVHMRTHTGDRPFSCNICGKTFTASCHYRVHMRIHTGEKPYKCTFCEKQFNNYGSHYRHIRTHQEWKCSEEEDEQDIPEVLEVKQEVTSIDSGDEGDLDGKLVPFMLSAGLKTTLLQTQGVPDKSKVEQAKQELKHPSSVNPRTIVADGSTLVSARAGASRTAVASGPSLPAGTGLTTSAPFNPQESESNIPYAPNIAAADGLSIKDQDDRKISVQLSTRDLNSHARMNPVKGNLDGVFFELNEPLKPAKAGARKQNIQNSTVYTRVITTQPSQLTRSEVTPLIANKNLKRQCTGLTTSPRKMETVKKRKTETGAIVNKSLSTSGIIAQLLLSQTDS